MNTYQVRVGDQEMVIEAINFMDACSIVRGNVNPALRNLPITQFVPDEIKRQIAAIPMKVTDGQH